MNIYVLLSLLMINTIDTSFRQFSDIWFAQIEHSPTESSYLKIPGGTYGLKNNLLFDTNDVKFRYVGNSSSLFTITFRLNSTMLTADRLLLVFHGLDTIATIELNGQRIGETSNMFTRYMFDIKNHVLNNTDNNNQLTVNFLSAVKAAEDIYNNHSQNYIVYPKCVPESYKGECHVNHIRKMQASFGWDWGPAFPGSAIWRNVQLIPVHQAVIMDYTIDVNPVEHGENWKVNVSILLELASSTTHNPIIVTLRVKLDTEDQSIMNSEKILINNAKKNIISSIILDVPGNWNF